jgi:hypothetical protein
MNRKLAVLAGAALMSLSLVPAQAAGLNADVAAMASSGTHQFYVYCSGGIENDYTVKIDGSSMKDAQAKAYAQAKAKSGTKCWPIWQGKAE